MTERNILQEIKEIVSITNTTDTDIVSKVKLALNDSIDMKTIQEITERNILQEIKEIVSITNTTDAEIVSKVKLALNADIDMKTIQEICEYTFMVPSYQRGYRWKQQQVKDLLDDINVFSSNDNKDEFYCLQPIVLNATQDSDKYELLDGQQRLTTIFIILKYLSNDECFSMEYNTRPGSQEFLEKMFNGTEGLKNGEDNIDIHYFKQAYDTIEKWFRETDVDKKEWKKTLLERSKVIWYIAPNKETAKSDPLSQSINVFTRINSGKIPLENAELIRGLFLHNSRNPEDATISIMQQRKIAAEWNAIEQELHDSEFWAFVTLDASKNQKKYPSRIEYFFDLLMGEDTGKQDDKDSTYRYYEKKVKENEGSIEDLWQEVKEYYYRFHEWFIDHELYHLIASALFCKSITIREALKEAGDRKQSNFTAFLRKGIHGTFIKEGEKESQIEKYSYGENNGLILKLLVAFNLHTHAKSPTRFPVAAYANAHWSIEHIHAQNSKDLSNEDWGTWAKAICESEEDESLNKMFKSWENSESSNDKKSVREAFDEELFRKYENMHNLGNLALLPKETNSSIGNKAFSGKRSKLQEFSLCKSEKDKRLVPIATMNVFQKYYSDGIINMKKWDQSDFDGYLKAINDFLKTLSPGEN